MDLISWFFLVVVVIIVGAILIGNFYVLVYFSHPEDGGVPGIWIYRGIVIAVLSFASYLIFAIPLDIACAKRSDSLQLPYDMNFVWAAINFAIAFIIIFVLPMAMILYSDDSEDFKETVKSAAKISALIAAAHLVFVLVYLLVINVAEVPVKHIAKTTTDLLPSYMKIGTVIELKTYYGNTVSNFNSVNIKLGFLNCFTLHLGILGSLLLICLEGYGLALFPMEFLNSFLNRPQIRDPEDFILTKFILREENEKVANEAKRIKKMKEDLDRSTGFIQKRAKQMQYNKDVAELKKVFLDFEEVMECFKQEENMQDVNPLVHYSFLIIGCVAYVASFMIVFHILLYTVKKNGKPMSYMLNNALEWFTHTFAQMVSLTLWLILSSYMLLCIIKGNMMFSALLSRFFGVHPFKVNGTWMSSFLVNSFMLLLTSLGLLTFLCREFESFLRYTTCERIFKHLLSNARFVKLIYQLKVVELGIVGVFTVVTCYLLTVVSKKSKITKIMRAKKKERMEKNKEEEVH